jgi:hypothetical protein
MQYIKFSELNLSAERHQLLQQAIDNRMGRGYFGLNAGIEYFKSSDPKYAFGVQLNNFNSVSGWATLGLCRFDEKKGKYVINFRGKGLGRSGKYN